MKTPMESSGVPGGYTVDHHRLTHTGNECMTRAVLVEVPSTPLRDRIRLCSARAA